MIPLSEEAYWEMMEERTALPYGGYGNAMAQEAAWYHGQGLSCPFDCAVCDSGFDPEEGMWETVPDTLPAPEPGDPWYVGEDPPF